MIEKYKNKYFSIELKKQIRDNKKLNNSFGWEKYLLDLFIKNNFIFYNERDAKKILGKLEPDFLIKINDKPIIIEASCLGISPNSRKLGQRSGSISENDTNHLIGRLNDKINQKYKKYKNIDLPIILAIDSSEYYINYIFPNDFTHNECVQAVYGKQIFQIRIPLDGSDLTSQIFTENSIDDFTVNGFLTEKLENIIGIIYTDNRTIEYIENSKTKFEFNNKQFRDICDYFYTIEDGFLIKKGQ
jgi:hypothetical protein